MIGSRRRGDRPPSSPGGPARSPDRPGRAGFVLLAVLWALVFVGLLAGAFLKESTHLVRIGANRGDELRARWAALGGVELVRNRLRRASARSAGLTAGRGPDGRQTLARAWNDLPALVGAAAPRCLGQVCVDLTIHDLGTRLNPNRAGEVELERFFRRFGAAVPEAKRAARAVHGAVHGGADPGRSGGGDERDGDALRPLRSVDELLGLPGLPVWLVERAEPHLTAEGRGRINVNAAPAPVLAAIPGMTAAGVDAVLRARRDGVAFRDLLHLLEAVGDGARRSLQREFARLDRTAVFEPVDIEVRSAAGPPGGPPDARIRGIFARDGTGVTLVKRAPEP